MSESITLSPFWSGVMAGTLGVFLISVGIVWLLMARHRRQIADLENEAENWLEEKYRLEATLAIAEQKLAALEKLEIRFVALQAELDANRDRLSEECANRARAEQEVKKIDPLERKLSEREQTIEQIRQESNALQNRLSEINARIDEERRQNQEKLELIKSTEQQMVHQFESLSAKILEEKSKVFSEQNRAYLDRLLGPLREQLGDFRKKVDDVYVADSKDRASLREAISSLNLENQRISREANNLAQALKGDKKLQGTWGELVLETVLEQSGLREGIEYQSQGGFRDLENRLLKPDVVVHLPERKDIVIDSKVSLLAYENYTSAEDEEVRKQALCEHIQAVKSHIKTLGEKDYTNLRGLRSLDFVLMFMPIETAFALAFEHDEALLSEAFQRNVIVVTPTTLLATLRTIENIWRYERQNENAKLIAEKAAGLYDKVRGFVEEFEKLGTQISTVQGTYESALNKLSQGKGNLLRQASRFVELGVKVKKTMPKSILDQTADDESESLDQEISE